VAAVNRSPSNSAAADDAAVIMKNAQKVIIVPGYGMAVARPARLREMGHILKKEGVEVKYAIHPVAGRMPGHMNVLLRKPTCPMTSCSNSRTSTPNRARADNRLRDRPPTTSPIRPPRRQTSPIYGMPGAAGLEGRHVMFIKRSLASGYAGIDNPLFYRDNT